MYIAHKKDDGSVQLLKDHLENVAQIAKKIANAFDSGDAAYQMGLAHDIGKYSKKFQERIRGEYHGSVDHSTAGGKELYKLNNLICAYGVMGHHTGLMNGGSPKQSSSVDNSGTFFSRLKKSLEDKTLEDYSNYIKEISLSSSEFPNLQPVSGPGFCLALFTRMLYSSLVDADYLDTEDYMSDSLVNRGNYNFIEELYDRYMEYIKKFQDPKKEIHKKRNEILNDCLLKAENKKGLYSLTVPTGGGKTVSSLGFALKHANLHKMDRIIYIIPYTSIIEQNAKVIADIVGAENVLEHHSSICYESGENEDNKKYLSTENWDAPIVVTTNIQFFESLFACRSSKCRKLHNIANSVLIFDEAQMLPTPYLLPCVKSIAELVKNYNVTAILCTATQPALDKFFLPEVKRTEICSNLHELYDYFKRVTISDADKLTDVELVSRLLSENQVLCIVNSRKHAQNLFKQLEGGYHLSTLMVPEHRKEVLSKIREDLKEGKECRVVSTSLVEAGVDLDFPTVYRAKNGLDSVIQAAGRCNREGNHSPEESHVYVFEEDSGYSLPSIFKQPVAGFEIVSREFDEIDSVQAIHRYFDWLYSIKENDLDKLNIVERLNYGWQKGGGSFPFKDIADEFHLIDQNTYPVFVPFDENARDLEKRIIIGERSRSLLREIGRYSVNVYENHLNELLQNGQVEFMDKEASKRSKDGIFILRSKEMYDEKLGLRLKSETGFGLFI